MGAISVHRAEAWTACKKAVVWIDEAELVAFGIGENDMGVAGVLTDVDMCRTDVEELAHRGGLIVEL